MNLKYGNMLEAYNKKDRFIITTNGVKNNSGLVMGAGLALAAKKMFPYLPYQAAEKLPYGYGSFKYHILLIENLILFQTKIHFQEESSYQLIEEGLQEFKKQCSKDFVYHFPPLGCGLGGLSPNKVKQMIEKELNEYKIIYWNFPSK